MRVEVLERIIIFIAAKLYGFTWRIVERTIDFLKFEIDTKITYYYPGQQLIN